MVRKKTKSTFIGIKLTDEQAVLLTRLKEALGSSTKTGVLLQGLDLLARSYHVDAVSTPGVLPADREVPTGLATSLELARLEAEAQRYNRIVEQTRNKTEEVIRQVVQAIAKVDEIVDRYGGDRSALIQVLLDIQRENHWLSKDALIWVSQKLNIPLSQVYQVATFYKAFSLVPKGRHTVSVCMGTACHVRGAPRLLDKIVDTLNIMPGQTSRDMRFSLSTVNCLGCCALGPVMVVDDVYYSKPSTEEIREIVAACE